LKGVAVVLAVIVLARFIVPKVLFQVTRTRSRELFLLSIVLICSAVAWATSELGLSLGLGAFLAGLIVSESEYSYQALEGILPFKAVFTGFFFVSIGMLLDTSFVLAQPFAVLGAGMVVLLLKALIAGGVALGLGMSTRAAVIVGLALSQIGEFSFVLSRVGVSSGLLDGPSYQMFLALAVLTMGVTPFVVGMAPHLAGKVSGWPGLRRFASGSYRGMVDRSDVVEPLRDHLVIVGFGVNGRNIAKAARVAGVSYEIVEMNPDTVRAVRAEGEPIRYGDATSRELLKSVSVDQARIVVIAISDPAASRQIIHAIRELSRKVYIIVRTRFVGEMQALYDLGANEVVPEEFETSVEIFTRVLLKYLVPRAEIEKFTTELRAHSYEMFRSLSRSVPSLGDLPINLSEMEISAIKVSERCPISGQTLIEAQLRTRFGVSVLAIMRGADLTANPGGTERIGPGDVLYVVGSATQCAEANRSLSNP
jgi:CPA2 family monovalent cation:H+ antiporter-2